VGNVDINSLTAGMIREKFLKTGRAAGTINQYIKRFKGFLRWAYQNDYLVSSDVYEKLSYLKDIPHKAKIADKYLEADELTALIASMDVPRWRLLTEFLALSGLRIGEALALDRDDIDMDYIHVYKTIQIGSGEIGDAKTMSSVRDVYIQPELAECLKEIDKAMKEQQKATRYTPTPYLFEGLDGGRAEYRAYNKYLKKRSKSVLGREISPHALRHTHTSLLAAQGIPFDVISRRLGHENSQITREIYFHITGGLRLADASKMAKVSLLAVGSAVGNVSEPRKIRKV
jgi:integrase